MAKYEILYIIRPNIEERRLAYEIQDFREGLYHIVNVEANDAVALNEFDRLSKINGDILRHMIVKLDA